MDNEDYDLEPDEIHVPPDPAITAEVFAQWRNPVYGATHPERLANPFWTWLVRSRLSAYQANELFSGPDSVEAGPCWSFNRFGQSRTLLPDGRTIWIAGEHEDHYDPDFHIYNDVTIDDGEGNIEILGYPRNAFPPTDFQSATLVDDQILLIGNLGYPEDRQIGSTQVLLLDTHTWQVTKLETTGQLPGWISNHRATQTPSGEIVITGGTVQHHDGLLENIEDWQFDLRDRKWTRLTNRNWRRWELCREDEEYNELWEMRQILWRREANFPDEDSMIDESKYDSAQLEAVASLYQPALEHRKIEVEVEQYNLHSIEVAGVRIDFVEDSYAIKVSVRGELRAPVVDGLIAETCQKLSDVEQVKYVAVERSPDDYHS